MKAKHFYIFLFLVIALAGCSLFKGKTKDKAEPVSTPQKSESATTVTPKASVDKTSSSVSPAVREVPPAPQQATAADQNYVINELTFEVKKLAAELKHLQSAMQEMQAKNQMWANPLSIYDKEIILENGGSIYGKIIYQDEKIVKVETLIGYLIVEKPHFFFIVTAATEKPAEQYVPAEIATDIKDSAPLPASTYVSKAAEPATITESVSRNANCVLVGNIKERKDRTGNTIFSGEVKNIGNRRADFVKVNFIFRKNWSGDTETRTTFVEGSYYTFEGSGITSNNSLLPGASGNFELVVPKNFGTFIGYSYNIDWEQYQ